MKQVGGEKSSKTGHDDGGRLSFNDYLRLKVVIVEIGHEGGLVSMHIMRRVECMKKRLAKDHAITQTCGLERDHVGLINNKPRAEGCRVYHVVDLYRDGREQE